MKLYPETAVEWHAALTRSQTIRAAVLVIEKKRKTGESKVRKAP